ncbi:MAG: SH3 domain-containing protein [Oscillatoriales cyanobacterium RM1_1_9]|nr:SH3 domain-containing protein [Oscillatoriales cyanobacterium SM2_3_0]NJO44875.1 SH3 domain-containing protein [Oscillatoriales cyanobacterium RM2_1_1]NJO71067.1 SH3 domain-containing protein [Oscillatoriales cyanobacterium RM1_1_9]
MNVLKTNGKTLIALLFSMVWWSSTQPVLAQFPSTIDPKCRTAFRIVATQEGELNLRDQPDYPSLSSAVIKRIPNGTEVVFNISDRTGDWAEVKIPGGQTGWVAARYLKYSHHGATDFNGRMRIRTLDGGAVNLRDLDNSQAVIGTLPNNATVEFQQLSGYYSIVATPDGKVGQVDNRFLVCN